MERTPIAERLEHELLHAAQVAGDWFHPHRDASQAPAAQPVTLIAAAPAAPPGGEIMGFITDVKNDLAAAAHDLAAHAVSFDQTVLPGLAAKLTALEGNPVVDSLLNAVHVPPEALAAAVQLIDKLEELYNPGQPAAGPDGVAPAPVAAG